MNLATKLPILLVRLNTASPDIDDLVTLFQNAMGLDERSMLTVNPRAGEPFPADGTYCGVALTGSGAMITDRPDWALKTEDWLRAIIPSGCPVIGICFGHQLIADMLGGAVCDNPNGWEIGTVEIRRTDASDDDALFRHLPKSFQAQAVHRQTVSRPPKGAVVLARSGQDDCHAFRYCQSVWGIQFHPEFSVERVLASINRYKKDGIASGLDWDAMEARVCDTPLARSVLKRFAMMAHSTRDGSLI